MSYQVLARKWRPGNFEELIGQKQTAQALINALESQRLHHAYLFTGTRGVGKTTIARILSKSLNCEKGITSHPCGECASCVEITQGNFVDLLEIDAASKTKVEDTRELLDNVQYRPTRGRYKVYLIDEVHMLSGHSFNALLKTLEEPPPHVIFLLATTDPQKMPVTVLSRCLQFHLRRMEQAEIIPHLQNILQHENIECESGALEPIADGADGSMRDALSLLDQAIAFCGNKIETAAVLQMLGSIDRTYAFELLDAVCQSDAALLMSTIKRISEYSPDFDELMADWLSLLHKIAVAQATKAEDDAQIVALAGSISPADLQLFYQLSLSARKDLAFAPHPRQGFEMAMLRILAFKPQTRPLSPEPAKKKANLTTESSAIENNQSIEGALNRQNQAQSEPLSSAQSSNIAASRTHDDKPVYSKPISEVLSADSSSATLAAAKIESLPGENIEEPYPALKVVVDNDRQQSQVSACETEFPVNLETAESKLSEKIALAELNENNWFDVTQMLAIEGSGLQVLLNSSAEFYGSNLYINHLAKVTSLLTQNARELAESALRKYFSQNDLLVKFNEVNELADTPKAKLIRLHEQAIDDAEVMLKANPQIAYLIENLDAQLPRGSITIND